MKTKKCHRCRDEFPLDGFPIKKRNRDERSGTCTACTSYINKRRYHANMERQRIRNLKPTDGIPWPATTNI